jgi:ligand-binding sensor domain-containing protein
MPAGGAPLRESAAGGALDAVAVSGRHLYYAKAGATAVSRLDPDADEEPLVLEAGAPVRALAPAPIGAVAATADGYAVCGEDGCARHRGTGPGRLPSGATTAVLFVAASAERPARLFVGTEAGLFIAADAGGSSEGRTCFVPGGDGDYAVADLAWDDARGAVWIAARERGAFRADPAAAQCALEPAGVLDGVTVSAVASRGGEAWFGTAEGLYRLGDADFADPRRWGAASARVNDIALSPSGIVWLATAGGACRWDPLTRAGACLVEPSELPNGDVHALAMRGEEKWLATPAGLHRWRGR